MNTWTRQDLKELIAEDMLKQEKITKENDTIQDTKSHMLILTNQENYTHDQTPDTSRFRPERTLFRYSRRYQPGLPNKTSVTQENSRRNTRQGQFSQGIRYSGPDEHWTPGSLTGYLFRHQIIKIQNGLQKIRTKDASYQIRYQLGYFMKSYTTSQDQLRKTGKFFLMRC